MNKKSTIIVLAGMSAIVAIGAYAVAVARQQQAPTAQALHLATATIREANDQSDEQFERGITDNGMEPGTAGFHLLRPVTDPLWSSAYGGNQPHYDYRWYGIPVRYQDIEYQRRLPIAHFPNFIAPLNAVVSQRRKIANFLGSAALVQVGSEYRVDFTFSSSGVAALNAALLPTTTFPDTNEYADWFRKTTANGQPPTTMMLAVVSGNITYIPFSVQDVLATVVSGTATVTVADRLPLSEATELAADLNRR